MMFIVPLVAFAIILGVNTIAGYDMSALYYYIICVAVQIVAAYISKDKPATTLMLFGLLGMVAMVIGTLTTGKMACMLSLSGGLFCSIMWAMYFCCCLLRVWASTPHKDLHFLIMM